MPAPRLGTALAIASVVWTSFWSWRLFGGRDLDVTVSALVWCPVALAAAGALVRKGKAAVALRAVAGAVLYLWGLFLFAWMFLIGGSLMVVAAILANTTTEGPRSSISPPDLPG